MSFQFKRLILGATVSSLILILFQTSKSQTIKPSESASTIRLTVTITSSKQFDSELKQENFQVWVDKDPAKIVRFTNEEMPVSVGLLFDSSGSMNALGTKLNLIKRALARFFELSNPANDYFLVGFNLKPQLLVDWTSDTASIVNKLDEVKPTGMTALFDACYLALEKLQHGHHQKRALLLISDGVDTDSRFSFQQVEELLKESGVLLYAINLQSSDDAGSALGMEGQAVLSELATTSGGFFLFVRKIFISQRNADEILATIANELRNQVELDIEPQRVTAKKKWRKFKVKLISPPNGPSIKNLTVRTRAGYYSNHN